MVFVVIMNLRVWRNEKKLTLTQTGDLLDLSASQVSRIENGKRTSVDRRLALAVFNIAEGAVTTDEILNITTTRNI